MRKSMDGYWLGQEITNVLTSYRDPLLMFIYVYVEPTCLNGISYILGWYTKTLIDCDMHRSFREGLVNDQAFQVSQVFPVTTPN